MSGQGLQLTAWLYYEKYVPGAELQELRMSFQGCSLPACDPLLWTCGQDATDLRFPRRNALEAMESPKAGPDRRCCLNVAPAVARLSDTARDMCARVALTVL